MGFVRDWMNTPYKVEDDEFDTVSAMQDPQDPVWPSTPVEPDVQQSDAPPETVPVEVRLANGALDFLNDVAEEVFDLPREQDTMAKKDSRRQAPVVDVSLRAATSWRGVTFDIGTPAGGQSGTKIVTERDDRYRVIVTNWGPGIAYLSADPGQGALVNPGVVQVAVNGSREFRTADEIWAFPAVPGTSQKVDVQDEYGIPE